MVDSENWASRLFVEIVEKVGRPGDPLFIYADPDVLAQCTDGQLSPAEALEDFCEAFNSISSTERFSEAGRLAHRWEVAGYDGSPKFFGALVMTVLAVTTRPPTGFEKNVYARQRELLGLRDLDEGAPDGYVDYVPGIWRVWNRWLVGAGARYGLPTADPRSLPNQGYARSQAFIRPRDKEIIYEFFEHAKYTSSDRPTAGDLFANFLFWLRNHSSQNPRLLERANDSDYSAEFCAFLPTALSYWTAQEALSIHRIQISAELLWDEVQDHFELVVDVRDAQWLTGSEVRLPNGDSYVVTFDDIYLYLFDQEVEQSVWFTDALANWPLHEKLSLSWSPRRCYLLVDDGNASWVETHRFEPGKSYRILAETEKILELMAAGILGPTEGAQIPGWEWICAVDLSEMTPEQMRRLLDLEGPVLKRPRGAAFVNGLRLGSRNHYFEGGEPDVRIGLDDELVSIFVDGRDRLSDLLPGIRGNQYLHLRLSELALDPGDHVVVVSTSTGKSKHSLLILAPGRSRGHDYEQDLAFQPVTRSTVGTSIGLASKYTPAVSESLIFRATSSAYAVAPDGTVYTISIAAETPPWLSASGFGSDGEIEDFLETTEISLPTEEQMYQLVYRRTPRSEWCVLSPASGNLHDEFPGTRVQMVNVLPPQLLEFVAADPKVILAKSLETVSHLKHRILTSRPLRVHASTERSRSARFHQHRDELYRADLSLGPSRVANPYNSLLDWLSEHEIGYCSLPKAEEAFRWLWGRDYPDVEVPNFFTMSSTGWRIWDT